MGRLIDADALIEMINNDISMTERFMNKVTNPLEMVSRNYISLASQLNTLKSFRAIIDEEPTAYDVEKVVAELEEEKQSNPCRNTQCKDCKYTNQCYEGEMCYKVGFDNAIEIVRKGGVE